MKPERSVARLLVAPAAVALGIVLVMPWLVAQAQADEQCFAETGQCISGRIYEFWEQNGGQAIFGMPISPLQADEWSDSAIEVQWFERTRLELHPENQPPDDVMMTDLGSLYLSQGSKPPRDEPIHRPDCMYFETGYNVCGTVLAIWQAHGIEMDGRPGISEIESRALFGAPLSGGYSLEFADGSSYVVQWFERARFDVGPDGVSLAMIGREMYDNSPPLIAPPAPTPVLPTPTSTPTMVPTTVTTPTESAPIAVGVVVNGGFIRTEPRIADDTVIGQVCPGDEVEFTEQQVLDDVLWYRVRVTAIAADCVVDHVPAGTQGWVSSLLLSEPVRPSPTTTPPTSNEPLPPTGNAPATPVEAAPQPTAPAATGLSAEVVARSNIFTDPNIRAIVVGQVNAGETVELLRKTPNEGWFQIRNQREVVGWVAAVVLDVNPSFLPQIPIVES